MRFQAVMIAVAQGQVAAILWVLRRPPRTSRAAVRKTRSVRHSGADQAAVTFCYEPGYVTVSVTDTGHGLATATGPQGAGGTLTSRSGGFGLAGMAERVASCGGSLTVGPGQAGGFAVTARLPVP